MDERVIKMVNEARWMDGLDVRTRLDDITYNPMRSQEEFVIRMMRENAKTVYGRKASRPFAIWMISETVFR